MIETESGSVGGSASEAWKVLEASSIRRRLSPLGGIVADWRLMKHGD